MRAKATVQVNLKMSREQKLQLIGQLQAYFREERAEEIGDLAAEFLLDFVTRQISPFIYNQAIDEVQTLLAQKMAALEEDVYALKIPVKLNNPQ